MAYRILVTEGQSPIGAALCKALENFTYLTICPAAGKVNWQDASSVRALLAEAEPDVVVNTLLWANTDLQAMPMDPATAIAVFQDLQLCMVHLSSHEVFSTQVQIEPLSELAQTTPDSPRGHLFDSVEQLLAAQERCLILRLSWLLDWPNGILDQVCHGLLNGGEFPVTDAWRAAPTQIGDVVRVIVAMIHQILCGADNWGVFHLHSSDSCSEAELADLVRRILQKELRAKLPELVVVPASQRRIHSNGWLAGVRCTNCFGVQLRSWRQGIKSRVLAWLGNSRNRDGWPATGEPKTTHA